MQISDAALAAARAASSLHAPFHPGSFPATGQPGVLNVSGAEQLTAGGSEPAGPQRKSTPGGVRGGGGRCESPASLKPHCISSLWAVHQQLLPHVRPLPGLLWCDHCCACFWLHAMFQSGGVES